jgi:hypothetical protein
MTIDTNFKVNYDLLKTNTCFGIATGYGLHYRGVAVRVPVGSRIFCSPYCPDRLLVPLNFLFNGYWGLLTWW